MWIDRKHILFLLSTFGILFFSTGCGGNKSVVKGEKTITAPATAPEWVNARPHNSAYYIGIGSSSKTSQPMDYQNIAKKNALNDLASEISVRVQGQTFLNSLEVNKNFSEEFISTISTSTDEKIENFEVAGIWETDREYWTYYRLSRAEYQRQKQEKKNKALSAANDYYQKGRDAEAAANIPSAFDLYMHGLFALKNYWNEVNDYLTESGKVYLDNEIYSSMQRIASGMLIKTNSPKITLSAENGYNVNIPVGVEYEGKPVRGITMAYTYQHATYMRPRLGITDESGNIVANISNVSTTEKTNNLAVSINLEPLLAGDLDKAIQAGLLKNMRTDSRQIPIELITPSFFVQSDEQSFDKPATSKVLASAMSGELAKQGMRIATSAKDANYLISIKSNTTEGETTQGFNVAFLEMRVSVTSIINGDVLYEESLSGIKGLQLNTNAAGTDAYKKGREKIEKEIVKNILQNIL